MHFYLETVTGEIFSEEKNAIELYIRKFRESF